MKILVMIAAFFSIPMASSFAGPGSGHSHGPQKIAKCKAQECTQNEIKEAVLSSVIPSFISRKKLDQSWAKVEVKSMEKKAFKGNLEWVLQFHNSQEVDQKKNLFVFVSTNGFLTGINHTGK